MAAARSNTNWFAVWVSIAVVVILVALTAVVLVLNNQATSPGATPNGNDVFDAKRGAVTIGEGKDTVVVFVDFQCPVCKNFEEQYGAALETAAADGRITLEYHPIAILDRFSQGTEYSSRSAGAAFCVAESASDKYLDFSRALFTNQPAENTSGLTNEQLADIAKQVGADKAASCITDETYKKFGAAQADQNDIKGTPTVEVNGRRLDLNKDSHLLTDLLG